MNENVIGKFCSVAKKDALIFPKEIPGYEAPAPQKLVEDKQLLKFVYTPIKYSISYNLNGGHFKEEYTPRESYTVESKDYTPDQPMRDEYTFLSWEPTSIPKGSTGDVNFTAKWKHNAILVAGEQLRESFIQLAGSKNQIVAIRLTNTVMEDNRVDVSSTEIPIYASFSNGIIYLYCTDTIHCNMDMRNAFNGFEYLYDITDFDKIVCEDGTNISGMCKNCKLITNLSPVSEWAHSGKFSDYTDAFTNTSAMNSGRVPSWYKWDCYIRSVSSTGKVLKEAVEEVIPGQTIYPPYRDGYKKLVDFIQITEKDKKYEFVYEPIQYSITYVLYDGTISGEKTQYTIEDETYYPPTPVKEEYNFVSWIPECINSGDFGNTSFIANYSLKENK